MRRYSRENRTRRTRDVGMTVALLIIAGLIAVVAILVAN